MVNVVKSCVAMITVRTINGYVGGAVSLRKQPTFLEVAT